MSTATGLLTVIQPGKTETFQWNGIQADRDKARETFERLMETGNYLASAAVSTESRVREQVSSFVEVEEIETTKGTVAVTISPALVGG